jgi:hypothetical protein
MSMSGISPCTNADGLVDVHARGQPQNKIDEVVVFVMREYEVF